MLSLSEPEQKIKAIVLAAGYEEDVMNAYLAETYPFSPEAPEWRRLSGTTNGVRAALFLNRLPDDPAWCERVQDRLGDNGGTTAQEQMFIAFVRGQLRTRHADLLAGFPSLANTMVMMGLKRPTRLPAS